MKLTEDYIDLCVRLEELGFVWQPRPGDWMLDKSDASVGMITTHIEDGRMLRNLNTQIPYGSQIVDLLAERQCRVPLAQDSACEWFDRHGEALHSCTPEAFADNDDVEHLRALVADFERFGA